ncbi:Protein BREAST CANCER SUSCEPTIBILITY 2-like protein [Vigna angularis]|uniref:Protein BREAST CANCER SUSCEPTIBILITY 2-like protein n=1 Tax=Phaseolus angularis TaxID=3914 RepID=A0A8T0K543_PHAAN|nr:Protein BREAST CANCER SUSCEPTIBILITY 2-like protein [Vigna angularis]
MCSWQILSHSPNNFHWQITEHVSHASPTPLPSPIPLPSMADLLLQGSPALLPSHDAGARGEERAIDETLSFSNSLFTTGSGKKVTISSRGLVRAKTLLDTIDINIQSTSKLFAFGETAGKQQLQVYEESPESKLHTVINSPSVGVLHALDNGFEERNSFKQAPIKFRTAGGRSISISSGALRRARSLLGDSDVGDLFEGGNAGDSVFSFPLKRQTDAAAPSDYSTPVVHGMASDSNFKTKSFTFPMKSSRQRGLPTKFPCEGDGINLTKKFDAVGEESDCGRKSTDACGQKSLYGRSQTPNSLVYDSSLNCFSSKVDTLGGATRRALADLSNTINTDTANNRQAASGKRRLGLSVTVSPFKKPRSSNSPAPLEEDVGKSPHDLSQLSSDISECKGEVSTRYPFHYPRVYIKDYFVGRPMEKRACFPNLSRQVTSVNAEKYVFHKGSGDNGIGAEAFVHLLALHGASMHFATKEWVTNHYKWIVWKLACYERYYPASSAGNFLTVSNVLEELKYRHLSGAGLCGWNGPVSPLEVSSTVSLLLHINGTYRAHWAERLGFCKVAGPPLAFKCIKGNGGLIPQTLAGITRIYPILYKERLSSGRSVVMSEKMENKMTELYNQRRSAVVDGIISEYQKESSYINYDSDSEGAKIYNMLETAEEPEFLMADMSAEQLSSFAAYKAKLNAIRQSEKEKSIEKALKDAGLGHREVTPFMKLRVVGLTYKTRQDKPKEGIVTIWNPTEKQRLELVEGGAYSIAGLMPSSSVFDILHLHARGSSTKWWPLSSNAREQFRPFFRGRKSTPLSSLGDIPVSNEFDIAAYIVHVGGVYTSNQHQKQWVFVTDGSIMNGLQSEKLINSLLAICFCSPLIDHDSSFPLISCNLAGSTVGFCNLIKKEKDHTNNIWVADANENSAYYLNFDSSNCSHLRNAASSIRRWADNSSLIIEKLKEKVLYVVGDDCKA